MKNKEHLKKVLVCCMAVLIFFVAAMVLAHFYQYHVYTINFNKKINAILTELQEKYPDSTKNEWMEIVNAKSSETSFLKEYGIELDKDAVLLENQEKFVSFLIMNMLIVFFAGGILIVIFLFYNYKKDVEISDITKYLEQINRRNYQLDFDHISEDELSILKNEIYKVTVMLKEQAQYRLQDKKNLKQSLSDISHQLKTPLTSILIILDNLIDHPDMETKIREEFLHDIKREIRNIHFLVQAILKLSKLDANTVQFFREKISIRTIINETIQNVAVLGELKNIKVEVQGNDTDCIFCDLKWQVEAMTNIVKNCMEHSTENSKICIRYSANKLYEEIIIQDFAQGIAKEDLPHIFERFYRGRHASEDSVGIGLSLAKTIIENEGGSISVKSDEHGTSFCIRYFFGNSPAMQK